MISARRARGSCPQCRSLLLNFYESSFLQLVPRGRVVCSTPSLWHARATVAGARKPSLVRQFSHTSRVFQQPTNETHSRDSQSTPNSNGGPETDGDIDTIVRQARQTFGNTLPPGYLTAEEYKLYERLYGPPLRNTLPEDVGLPLRDEDGRIMHDGSGRNALFRETASGQLEQVEYTLPSNPAVIPKEDQELSDQTEISDSRPLTDAQVEYLNVTANNSREYDALVKLQRDFEAARLRAMDESPEHDDFEEANEEYEPEEEEEEWEEEEEPGAAFEKESRTEGRYHRYTTLGKFSTYPSTLYLPQRKLIGPITELLGRTEPKHIKLTAEKVFGGPGLPNSPSTPELKRNLPMKGLAIEAGHHRMSDIEADAFMAASLPGLYASTMSALVETRKRLGSSWLRGLIEKGGPRVLEVGAGGAGLVAWQEVIRAEWNVLREEGQASTYEPPGKKTVVVGSDALRHRISRFLHNTTFLPRLPDYLHTANLGDRQLDNDTPVRHKTYDVIIATHMLMGQPKHYKRKQLLDNLWSMLSPEGGVLVVIEKGHPRGFEAVADVRDRVLEKYILPPSSQAPPSEVPDAGQVPTQREPGMIVAPCTNHSKCPMYLTAGESPGRKDYCHFKQRFIRPPFLQKLVGGTHRNHEDIKFSYISIRRGAYEGNPLVSSEPTDLPATPFLQGTEASDRAFAGYETLEDTKRLTNGAPNETKFNPLTLPRLILTPIKRRGHITMDVCTPAGAVERWTVPKSFSKQAYHDARKSEWGDLWALGAKTRITRTVRVGRGSIAADAVASKNPNAGDIRSGQAAPNAKGKRRGITELLADQGMSLDDAQETFAQGKAPRHRRMGKGDRKVKMDDLLSKLGLENYDDEAEQDGVDIDSQIRETRRIMRKERGKKL